MGRLKVLEIPAVDVHGRRVRGRTQKLIQIERVPNPFEKGQKRTIQVTATKPHDKAGPMLQQIERTTDVYHGTTFMGAIQKAQAKNPGRSISLTTLDLSPEYVKEEKAEREALLRGMS